MEKLTTRHELVGMIARIEVDAHGTVSAAADRTGMARSQLYRIFQGDPTVTRTLYRRVERAYGLPIELFAHVLDGDSEWIEAADLEPQTKRFVLDSLQEIRPPAPARRKGARRGA